MDTQGQEFPLDSGAVLHVTIAPWPDAKRLHNELLRALKGTGVGALDLNQLKGAMSAGKLQDAALLNLIADRLMELAASDAVEAAIFKCAERVLYKATGTDGAPIKVSRLLFDDPVVGTQARGDFYAICWRIIEVNLRPFLAAILSAFEARARNGVAARA